ncbi:hypothetical protein [Arenibacter troitsensis]|uniref:Uncharacterized protein n=1 Tax=Arenibacter troitsensis TaxID=188872 RepID=A0A1X7J7W4_9FLAO|nr:hypothetical protein [Arenibacter troitsensis]SMG23601.1 hypothetical protein SAMN03080602_01459 [Arenibacter troitsensis]
MSIKRLREKIESSELKTNNIKPFVFKRDGKYFTNAHGGTEVKKSIVDEHKLVVVRFGKK